MMLAADWKLRDCTSYVTHVVGLLGEDIGIPVVGPPGEDVGVPGEDIGISSEGDGVVGDGVGDGEVGDDPQ